MVDLYLIIMYIHCIFLPRMYLYVCLRLSLNTEVKTLTSVNGPCYYILSDLPRFNTRTVKTNG